MVSNGIYSKYKVITVYNRVENLINVICSIVEYYCSTLDFKLNKLNCGMSGLLDLRSSSKSFPLKNGVMYDLFGFIRSPAPVLL